jgi:hypothetical protein
VTGYNVYDVSGATATKIGASSGNSPGATLNALTPNTAYHLR